MKTSSKSDGFLWNWANFYDGMFFLFIFQWSGIGLFRGLVSGVSAYCFWKKGEDWMRRSEPALVGAKAEK